MCDVSGVSCHLSPVTWLYSASAAMKVLGGMVIERVMKNILGADSVKTKPQILSSFKFKLQIQSKNNALRPIHKGWSLKKRFGIVMLNQIYMNSNYLF